MPQPRANIGQWVPEVGDPSPFGDITLAIPRQTPGITYVEGPDGFGVHLSEAAQVNRTIAGSNVADWYPWPNIAPQWAGLRDYVYTEFNPAPHIDKEVYA